MKQCNVLILRPIYDVGHHFLKFMVWVIVLYHKKCDYTIIVTTIHAGQTLD